MFEWFYNILMSLISFVLGLFGMNSNKKSVHFVDEVTEHTNEEDETKKNESTENESM